MKKFLILFIVLSLCVSCFSITAFASDGEEETDTRNILQILRDVFSPLGPIFLIKDTAEAIGDVISNNLPSWISSVKTAIDNFRTNVATLLTSVKDNVASLKNEFADKFPKLYDIISNFKYNFDENISQVKGWLLGIKYALDDKLSGLYDKISNFKDNFDENISQVKGWLEAIKDAVDNRVVVLLEKISNFKDNFDENISQVKGWLQNIKNTLDEKLVGLGDVLRGLRNDITYIWNNLGNKLKSVFGVPSDVKPDTSIGNELDKESNVIIGNAQGAFDFVSDAFDKLAVWGSGFLVVGYFINSLTQISFLNYLINLSLGLGLLALSLNLFGSILTASKGNKPNGAKGGKTP